jgi:sugar phosphate permease
MQIGNLQALAQFLSNASKSVSGTLADILSPSRMIIFGTLLTTLNKPMFAASGYIYATFGTLITLYWVTAGVHSMQYHAVMHSDRFALAHNLT